MPARISLNRPTRPEKKPREGMSASHLAMIRNLVCCLCSGRKWPEWFATVPHHLLRTGEHGIGRKSSDRWAIPLCGPHHEMLHRRGDEETYLADRGIDGRALASALWAARGDQEAMERVVFRFRQEAAMKRRMG